MDNIYTVGAGSLQNIMMVVRHFMSAGKAVVLRHLPSLTPPI